MPLQALTPYVELKMSEAIEILGITGAIYLTIAIGYLSVKTGIFVRSEMQVFGRFTINFALPALLFNSLSRLALGEIFNWQYLITYAVGTLFMVILGLLWNLKIQGHKISYSSVLTMGMSCSNSGFVGFPYKAMKSPDTAGATALSMIPFIGGFAAAAKMQMDVSAALEQQEKQIHQIKFDVNSAKGSAETIVRMRITVGMADQKQATFPEIYNKRFKLIADSLFVEALPVRAATQE